MAKGNAFAIEVLKLLKRSGFPANQKPKEALRQVHTVVTALNNRMTAFICAGNHNDEVSQGIRGPGGGGPGPHRLDLLLHYSSDTDFKTRLNTDDLIHKYLGNIDLNL
jgi:hypothetical protein